MPVRAYDNTLRRQQADATRLRILTAVRDLLAGGSTSLQVPEIAARAGVSEPTIYRHFPNRDALLDAAADSVSGSSSTRKRSSAAAAGRTGRSGGADERVAIRPAGPRILDAGRRPLRPPAIAFRQHTVCDRGDRRLPRRVRALRRAARH